MVASLEEECVHSFTFTSTTVLLRVGHRSPCDSCWMDVLNISLVYVKHHLAGEVHGKLLLCASVFHWSHRWSLAYGHKIMKNVANSSWKMPKIHFQLVCSEPLIAENEAWLPPPLARCVILPLHQLKLSTFVSTKKRVSPNLPFSCSCTLDSVQSCMDGDAAGIAMPACVCPALPRSDSLTR